MAEQLLETEHGREALWSGKDPQVSAVRSWFREYAAWWERRRPPTLTEGLRCEPCIEAGGVRLRLSALARLLCAAGARALEPRRADDLVADHAGRSGFEVAMARDAIWSARWGCDNGVQYDLSVEEHVLLAAEEHDAARVAALIGRVAAHADRLEQRHRPGHDEPLETFQRDLEKESAHAS